MEAARWISGVGGAILVLAGLIRLVTVRPIRSIVRTEVGAKLDEIHAELHQTNGLVTANQEQVRSLTERMDRHVNGHHHPPYRG